MKNGTEIGRLVRQRREEIGMSQRTLAAHAEKSNTHIGKIEHGERNPSAKVLRKIAEPLGISVYELFRIAGFLPEETDEASALAQALAICPDFGKALLMITALPPEQASSILKRIAADITGAVTNPQ